MCRPNWHSQQRNRQHGLRTIGFPAVATRSWSRLRHPKIYSMIKAICVFNCLKGRCSSLIGKPARSEASSGPITSSTRGRWLGSESRLATRGLETRLPEGVPASSSPKPPISHESHIAPPSHSRQSVGLPRPRSFTQRLVQCVFRPKAMLLSVNFIEISSRRHTSLGVLSAKGWRVVKRWSAA